MRIAVTALVAAVCVLPIHAQAQIKSVVVASGLTSPLGFIPDPAFRNVFYIVEQEGLVKVLREGRIQPEPFADFRDLTQAVNEQGLLGMAFAPDAATGRVFFNYTNNDGDTVVARYQRTARAPFRVDPSTRLDLRWPSGERVIRQPYANHNGGNLVFGPDGYLYVGLGDGGSFNDPQNMAQNPSTLLGKMLRLDVNVADADANGYRVPADNPFLDGVPVSAPGEVWSFGLRNPWRYSFDDFGAGATGALVIGDVGQNAREEINYEPPGAGGRNYGWRVREGRIPTPGIPVEPPAFGPLTDPIYDYPRSEGRAITGGFVYRGHALGAHYQGRYFFADYQNTRVLSLGLTVDPATGEAIATDLIEHTNELGGAAFLRGVASFGRDLEGELYMLILPGQVVKIVSDSGVAPNPARDVRAVVTGSTVTVSWTAPSSGPVPSAYQLEAGSVPGGSNLGVVPASNMQSSLTFAGIPPGTYYVRVRSLGAGGASAASNEITIVVAGGDCFGAPPALTGLASTVNGRSVMLAWAVPSTADGPTSLLIEAGGSSGAANIAVLTIDGGARALTVVAPPGQYFVRIRGRNVCGSGAASNEIVVTVF